MGLLKFLHGRVLEIKKGKKQNTIIEDLKKKKQNTKKTPTKPKAHTFHFQNYVQMYL